MLNKNRKKHSPFTLIEQMIVLFLIVLVLGCLKLGLPTILGNQKFEKEMAKVTNKLELLQELMLDAQVDLGCTLIQKEGALLLRVERNSCFSPLVEAYLKEEVVEGVDRFYICHQGKELSQDSLSLLFDATLGACPRAELLFVGKKGSKRLLLPGFPTKF